jgi:hypothetical protein
MTHLFDEFFKSLEASIPRRESLRRLGPPWRAECSTQCDVQASTTAFCYSTHTGNGDVQ